MSRKIASATRVRITVGAKSILATLASSVSFAAHAGHERSLSTRKIRALTPIHIGTRDANARLRRRDHRLLAARA
jgi:hypothetical protein